MPNFQLTKEKTQVDMIRFALRYPGWNTFRDDKRTVEHLCANVNLGLLKVNEFGQFSLKSRTKAKEYIAART